MPQTLMAILALVIVVTFSLNMQREVVSSQQEMISNEVEVMATGVALQAMETIRARAFDQAVASDPTGTYATSDFSSTSGGTWGGGGPCRAFDPSGTPCTDLDDFDGMSTATIPFEMRGGGGSNPEMDFEVDVGVRYVTPTLQPAAGRTLRKEVTISIQDASASGSPFLRRPIFISRVFAYNFGATETGHGGGRGGRVDHAEFEDAYQWLIGLISDSDFRSAIVSEMQSRGLDTLANAISNQDEDAIKSLLEGNKPAREAVIDYRANYGSD